MKLLVENVAKIQHAEVAVDGISILAGYNGTGKSTISKALSGVIAAYTNLTAEVKHSRYRASWKMSYLTSCSTLITLMN